MTTTGSEAADRTNRWLAALSVATTVYFILTAIAVHFVDRRYDPISDYMSDYVIGPGGDFFTVAIYGTSAGALALAIGLWRRMRPPARPDAGIILIGVFAIAYAVVATFPTDILESGQLPTTLHGTLHLVGATIGWVAFPSASMIVASAFRKDPAFAPASWPALVLAGLALLSILAFLMIETRSLPLAGLGEKTFIACRELWLLTAGIALHRASR